MEEQEVPRCTLQNRTVAIVREATRVRSIAIVSSVFLIVALAVVGSVVWAVTEPGDDSLTAWDVIAWTTLSLSVGEIVLAFIMFHFATKANKTERTAIGPSLTIL